MLEFLKGFFSSKDALTFDELTSAVEAYNADPANKDNQIKPVDLSSGDYVSKSKFDDKVKELESASGQITTLTEAAKAYEGVDVGELQGKITSIQSKYDTDTAALKAEMNKKDAVDLWLDTHPSKHRALLKTQFDLDKINIGDDGKITGIEEQGTTIAEVYKDLFIIEGNDAGGGMPHGKTPSSKDPGEMSMDEYRAWREKQ